MELILTVGHLYIFNQQQLTKSCIKEGTMRFRKAICIVATICVLCIIAAVNCYAASVNFVQYSVIPYHWEAQVRDNGDEMTWRIADLFDGYRETRMEHVCWNNESLDDIPEITFYFNGATIKDIWLRNGYDSNDELYKHYARPYRIEVAVWIGNDEEPCGHYIFNKLSDTCDSSVMNSEWQDGYRRLSLPEQFLNVTKVGLYIKGWHKGDDAYKSKYVMHISDLIFLSDSFDNLYGFSSYDQSWTTAATPTPQSKIYETTSKVGAKNSYTLEGNRVYLYTNERFDVYSGPGTSYYRGADGKATVSTNDWIDIYGNDNGWTLISYEIGQGRYRFGYVKSSLLYGKATTSDIQFENSKTQTASDVTMTDDPVGFSSTLTIITAGQPITVLAHYGDQAYIEYKNMRGFIDENAVISTYPSTSKYATTNRAKVNVRTAPDKTSKKVKTIKKSGTRVELISAETGADNYLWYFINSEDDKSGYIREDFLTIEKETASSEFWTDETGDLTDVGQIGTATTLKNDVNIRSEADKRSKKVSTIQYKNSMVSVISDVQGNDGYPWYKINYNGYTGFVRGDFLQFTETTPVISAESSDNSVPEKSYVLDYNVLSNMSTNELFQNIEQAFDQITKPWSNAEGYSTNAQEASLAFYNYAKPLADQGVIEDCIYCAENNSIVVVPHDGITTVYGFGSKGTNAGDYHSLGSMSVMGMTLSNELVNQVLDEVFFHDVETHGVVEAAEYVYSQLEDYTLCDRVGRPQNTVNGLKDHLMNMKANNIRVLFWDSHGGLFPVTGLDAVPGKQEYGVMFTLPEKYSDEKAMGEYSEDIAAQRIVREYVESWHDYYFCVTYKFFERYLPQMDGGLFICGACYSAADGGYTWRIFQSKGFDAYIGASGEISSNYSDAFIGKLTENLCKKIDDDYLSLGKAFDQTQQWQLSDGNGVRFILYPSLQSSFKIVPSKFKLNFTVADRNGDAVDSTLLLQNDSYSFGLNFGFDENNKVNDTIEVPPFAAGTYRLIINATNYLPFEQELDVVRDSTTHCVLILDGSCEGTVTDRESGTPLPGASVTCMYPDQYSDEPSEVCTTTYTDENGHFLLEHLDAGSYTLKFSQKYYEDQNIEFTLNGTHPNAITDASLLKRYGSLTIQVVDEETGEGIPAATVQVISKDIMGYEEMSDDIGRVFFEKLPAGNYTILGRKDSYKQKKDVNVRIELGVENKLSEDLLMIPDSIDAIYQAFIQQDFGSDCTSYELFDIDQDGIPELIVYTFYRKGEAWFYTYVDGKVCPLNFNSTGVGKDRIDNTWNDQYEVYKPLSGEPGILYGGNLGMGSWQYAFMKKKGFSMYLTDHAEIEYSMLDEDLGTEYCYLAGIIHTHEELADFFSQFDLYDNPPDGDENFLIKFISETINSKDVNKSYSMDLESLMAQDVKAKTYYGSIDETYSQILEDYNALIQQYKRFENEEGFSVDPLYIERVDLDEDGIEELLFIAAQYTDEFFSDSDLYIFKWKDDHAWCALHAGDVVCPGGNGHSYEIYQIVGSSDLIVECAQNLYHLYRFTLQNDQYILTDNLAQGADYNENWEGEYVYIINSKYVSKTKLVNQWNSLSANKRIIIASTSGNKIGMEPNETGYDIMTFGTYPQTEAGNDQTPIEWLILDRKGDHVLLLSRYGLDTKKYHDKLVDIEWPQCTLRTWLNKDFYTTAFSQEERQKIIPSQLEDSTDKVFLLSDNQANKYFNVIDWIANNQAGNTKSRCKATPYAISRGAHHSDSGFGYWWLRSPGSYLIYAATVSKGGDGSQERVYDYGIMVRPAIWITLNETELYYDEPLVEKSYVDESATNQVGMKRAPKEPGEMTLSEMAEQLMTDYVIINQNSASSEIEGDWTLLLSISDGTEHYPPFLDISEKTNREKLSILHFESDGTFTYSPEGKLHDQGTWQINGDQIKLSGQKLTWEGTIKNNNLELNNYRNERGKDKDFSSYILLYSKGQYMGIQTIEKKANSADDFVGTWRLKCIKSGNEYHLYWEDNEELIIIDKDGNVSFSNLLRNYPSHFTDSKPVFKDGRLYFTPLEDDGIRTYSLRKFGDNQIVFYQENWYYDKENGTGDDHMEIFERVSY